MLILDTTEDWEGDARFGTADWNGHSWLRLSTPLITDFQTLANHRRAKTEDHQTLWIEPSRERPHQSSKATITTPARCRPSGGEQWNPSSCLVRHPFQVPGFRS
ncbi:hypothetical protein M758_12G060200 [Ceratodon purpureus]|nr:hypothetical protein M758_12G060200 [Ceratodon purpureus]